MKNKIISELQNIELFYKGFHNTTYKAMYKGKQVQYRVPLNELADHSVEKEVLSKVPKTIFYEDGYFIREWSDSKTAEEVELNNSIQKAIINKVKEFHNLDVRVPKMDWFYYKKGSKKYQQLVQKYSKTCDLVTGHCDLGLKNILISKDNEVELIDFEWVRKVHPFFDAITLYLNGGFSKKLLQNEFKISSTEFSEMVYIAKKFREYAYEKIYSSKEFYKDAKPLSEGYTNKSFVKNDIFMQQKIKNGFNHRISSKIFNKLDFVQPVIFENKDIVIRKFIKGPTPIFSNVNMRGDLAKVIAKLHKSKIKLPNNEIAKRIEHYVSKLQDHQKFNETFDKETQKIIIQNSMLLPNEVPSHNDLNRNNILCDINGNIKLIDLEYASMNSKYFDLAYHCADMDYDKNTEQDFLNKYSEYTHFSVVLEDYYRVKAIVCFYGISWSLTYNPNFDFEWLIKHVKENIGYLTK